MSKFSPFSVPVDAESTFRQDTADFRDKVRRALRFHGATSADRAFIAGLRGKRRDVDFLLASDFPAKLRLSRQLNRSIDQLCERNSKVEFAHVTLINPVHETSSERTCLSLPTITKPARRILSSITRDWIAHVELVLFANRTHEVGGRVISPHVHAILWGPNVVHRARAVAQRVNARVGARVDGMTPMRVQRIGDTPADRERVIGYPLRAPSRNKTVYFNPRTGCTNLHESEASDRPVQFLRMLQLLSLIEAGRLSFAGGAGVAIRRRALARVHARLAPQRSTASRAAQLSEIEDFWAEFMPRTSLRRFRPPRIIVR